MMGPGERLRLLEDMCRLQHREAENVDVIRTFLPLPSHRLALRPEIVVVRGVRGSGKSALFQLLDQLGSDTAKLRAFFGDDRLPEARWVNAFTQGPQHPEVTQLDHFARQAEDQDLRAFWIGHLLQRLVPLDQDLVPKALVDCWREHPLEVGRWVPLALAQLGPMITALDRFEQKLAEDSRMVFASYDHLDRIGAYDPSVRRRYVSTLLALWLSLSNRYSRLRAKIFIREDLFQAGELGFPDATKLRPRSTFLDWDVRSLYRVVVRHMANLSEEIRSWLQPIRKLELEDRGELGWMPGEMPEPVQKALADRLAGEIMGTGVKKGYTYRWIPNRLQDAQGQIVPRSILCLLGFAAAHARRDPPKRGHRLLRPQDLHAGLEPTSRERVAEIGEEFPLVKRIENLRGLEVLLDRKVALEALGRPAPGEGAVLERGAEQVFDELLRLGVLKIRPDGRVDVPDIYRYGYGIKRRGGVARPK